MLVLSSSSSVIHIHLFNVLLIPKEKVCMGLALNKLYMSLNCRNGMNGRLEKTGGIDSIDLVRKCFSVCPPLLYSFRCSESIYFVCAW